MSEGYKEMMRQNEMDEDDEEPDAMPLGDYGDEEQGEDELASSALSGDDLDEHLEDQEEMDDARGKLKIPDDLKADADESYDEQEDDENNPFG